MEGKNCEHEVGPPDLQTVICDMIPLVHLHYEEAAVFEAGLYRYSLLGS